MIGRVTAVLLLAAAWSRSGEAQASVLHVSFGVHGAYPEYAAVSLGLQSMHETRDGEQRGLFVVLEPGVNGGRLSIGQQSGYPNALYSTHLGVLQTWGSPPENRPGVTYIGGEQRVRFQWFLVGLGFYSRVSGTQAAGLAAANQRNSQSILITGVLGAHFAF